ncbi:MAG: FAD-dependent oxidoreductase [Akkermansiaceae bacterium]|nr:FAD-dependent oxidoreductase [Akkermansiaceae bacterium]
MFATFHKEQCPPISPWTNVCDPSGLGSRRLSRRSALKLASGLVAAGWSPFGSRSAAADEATVFDCVVIGAGVAGLAAARKLHAANQRVVVLEARDRIGGRVWTDMSSPDGPIELGAQWVHGIHGNPLAKLCAQIGIQTFTTNYNSRIVIGADGRRWTEREADEREKQFKGVRREVHKLRKQLRANKVPDQPLGRVWSDVLASRTLNAADSERLAFEANIEIEHEYGADLSQLSLYEYDQDASEQGGDMVIPGGYAQIPAWLARGLDIQLREVVQSVTVNANGVEVRTERGVFRGKCALVTLPLGVLQAGAVKFDPPLPEKKLAAIRHLGSGRLDKVCLRFPRTFWPETHLLNFAGSRTGEFAEWINAAAFLHAPVLYGYNT